jgi:hypothetical protein
MGPRVRSDQRPSMLGNAVVGRKVVVVVSRFFDTAWRSSSQNTHGTLRCMRRGVLFRWATSSGHARRDGARSRPGARAVNLSLLPATPGRRSACKICIRGRPGTSNGQLWALAGRIFVDTYTATNDRPQADRLVGTGSRSWVKKGRTPITGGFNVGGPEKLRRPDFPDP